MEYRECIEYLYTKLPMFSRTGAAALKLDLSNTIAICKVLGNPENHFPSIHIAGTNGKGSVSHMLASVFQEAGYKTGLYTSPHVHDFRERIRINGQMIPENDVIHFTEKIKPFIETVEPSFFEVTVGMAFEHFAKEGVDIAVIETGLGGRLDSTNVITPLLSVITNIGMDHVQLLGDTLEKIAFEKAGIIKRDTPVVIGRTQEETSGVFLDKAKQLNAPIFFSDQQFIGTYIEFSDGISSFNILNFDDGHSEIFESDLTASYQSENIATVIAAIQKINQLEGCSFNIAQQQLKKGIKNVKKNTGLIGRWDQIQKHPHVFLDVGHNEDGIKKILEQIELFPHNRLHIILGMSMDKNVSATLSCLPKHATYYFTQAHLPRAMPCKELEEIAGLVGLMGKTFDDVNDALAEALLIANTDDLIIVCGSIFVVAEVNIESLRQ